MCLSAVVFIREARENWGENKEKKCLKKKKEALIWNAVSGAWHGKVCTQTLNNQFAFHSFLSSCLTLLPAPPTLTTS